MHYLCHIIFMLNTDPTLIPAQHLNSQFSFFMIPKVIYPPHSWIAYWGRSNISGSLLKQYFSDYGDYSDSEKSRKNLLLESINIWSEYSRHDSLTSVWAVLQKVPWNCIALMLWWPLITLTSNSVACDWNFGLLAIEGSKLDGRPPWWKDSVLRADVCVCSP